MANITIPDIVLPHNSESFITDLNNAEMYSLMTYIIGGGDPGDLTIKINGVKVEGSVAEIRAILAVQIKK